MDLNTITTAQFKAQFYRDFPYLSNYDPAALYNSGDQVYYPTTRLFYQCIINGTTGIAPNSDATKWTQISDSVNNYVLDQDITNAFAEAQVVFNQGLFGTDAQVTLAFLYCAAHFLCNDLKAAQAGINGTGAFPVQARTVGSVSESYAIPEAYTKSPVLAVYTSSTYGMKYLAMVMPQLVGNMGAVYGGTNP